MWIKPAPAYEDIFHQSFDEHCHYLQWYEGGGEMEKVIKIAPPQLLWFEYVDDMFSFWSSTQNNFNEFLPHLNDLSSYIELKLNGNIITVFLSYMLSFVKALIRLASKYMASLLMAIY